MEAIEKYNKVKEHFNSGKTLMWNDPDPIEGNDYKVTLLENIPDDEIDSYSPILIHYNNGSEAQVFLHELICID